MAWHGMGNYMYTGNPAYSDSDIHPSSGKASQVHIATKVETYIKKIQS